MMSHVHRMIKQNGPPVCLGHLVFVPTKSYWHLTKLMINGILKTVKIFHLILM